jgi:hypothetical protein
MNGPIHEVPRSRPAGAKRASGELCFLLTETCMEVGKSEVIGRPSFPAA